MAQGFLFSGIGSGSSSSSGWSGRAGLPVPAGETPQPLQFRTRGIEASEVRRE